jgi:outer membrane protein assembly factor BamB
VRSVVLAVLILMAATPDVAANWPSFRGDRAMGVADGVDLPVAWNAVTGEGVRWRAHIPGLAHASPVVWNNRVYVVSAVADGSTLDMKAEGVVFAKDTVDHEWRLYCLDGETGREIWMRTLHKGAPRQPRHVKGTYANATPATNGSVIAMVLGSEGLFVTDMEGRLKWRQAMTPPRPDFSLDAASSPVIVDDVVIVQQDWQRDGFAAAYEIESGRERWRIARAEGMSWSTPGVWTLPDGRTQVVFNSTKWVRAHDPRDGRELWRLDNSAEGAWDRVATPIGAGDLLLLSGGGNVRPLYAVRPSASGDITLKPGETNGAAIAWAAERASPYLPTPLVYRGLVYVCGSSGVLTVYRADSGSMVYRSRVADDAGAFAASPIAAGGRIYLPSEEGDVFVIAAGERFERLARNPMGAPLFATPAVAGPLLIVRTASEVVALGK